MKIEYQASDDPNTLPFVEKIMRNIIGWKNWSLVKNKLLYVIKKICLVSKNFPTFFQLCQKKI